MIRPRIHQSWRGATFVSVGILTIAVAVIVSCSHHELDPWTDHREPPRGMLATEDGMLDLTTQTVVQADTRSRGCIKCHPGVGDPHGEIGAAISCVDCHGGNGLAETIEEGHPKPDHPENFPTSANPERSYLRFLHENQDWVRFVNPGDLRVADISCSPCHADEVINVKKSVMTTAAHFWGVAGYANGIVSAKRSIFGESYSPQGRNQLAFTLIRTENGGWRKPTPEEAEKHSISPLIAPLPHWEITQTGNIYRVFEQGSRLGGPALGFNGLPLPVPGIPDKLEDPGRPNNRLSDRGLGTLNRVDLPILNVQKTRLNDPHLSLMGTNDQPGDYRSSGCTACHVVYANDRDPYHAGHYAKYGNMGRTRPDNPDVSIPKDESGHPLKHEFTTAIPSSNCMVCHMHQPNSFVNSYYGFTMWTYETDGEPFWPEKQKDPTHEEYVEGLMKNPEGAAVRGKWIDNEFLRDTAPNINPTAKHTQFADYHGHGWMFRGVYKTDRKGNLLDEKGNVVPYDDPMKFQGSVPIAGSTDPYNQKAPDHARRAVHLKDIHAEKGMHCVDCHFRNDAHGDGNIYHEYQAQVEIRCDDCHGTATEYASLVPSGPASKAPGHRKINLSKIRTAYGKPVLEWQGERLVQNSMVDEGLSWVVPQVQDSVTPGNENYSRKAAYYKTIQKDNRTWGSVPADHSSLAHQPEKMECYACHTSWVTACFGCHLPQKANMKTPMRHFEEKELRNFASYNPQVVRDAEFMLGVAGDVKNNAFAPVRSSSAVIISSEDAQRRRIYGQIPTIAANGMSSQLFNTHFPHTVRTTETRQCADCHVSENDDNNAWLAQTYLLGTQTVGFMGFNCWIGTGPGGIHAVRVTEWEEPQAVIGSKLQEMAWPDHFAEHMKHGRVLQESEHHGGTDTRSVELRGEYLYTAQGEGGFRVYDVAQVNNKDFSEKIVTQPVSPLGQDTQVDLPFATAVALPFNNNISMSRLYRPENREQRYEYDGQAQNMHEVYRYAFVSDRVEGLVVIDIDSLTDGDPRNNFVEKVVSFNPQGILAGAEHLEIAGTTVYVCCDAGLVAVSVDDPRAPRVIKALPWPAGRKTRFVDIQFRYAFVCDDEGLKVVDITDPAAMHPVAKVEIADARSVYVAKTYAYVAGGAEGLVVVDVEKPTQPKIDQVWNDGGAVNDLCQVKVAMTYDTVYAYLADGANGLHVVQLVGAGDGPRSPYGFSPRPMPSMVATFPTSERCIAVGKALDRDRAVDESGNQVTVFGRIGGRPMNREEMRRLYLENGRVYRVRNEPPPEGAAASVGGSSAEIPEKGN